MRGITVAICIFMPSMVLHTGLSFFLWYIPALVLLPGIWLLGWWSSWAEAGFPCPWLALPLQTLCISCWIVGLRSLGNKVSLLSLSSFQTTMAPQCGLVCSLLDSNHTELRIKMYKNPIDRQQKDTKFQILHQNTGRWRFSLQKQRQLHSQIQSEDWRKKKSNLLLNLAILTLQKQKV